MLNWKVIFCESGNVFGVIFGDIDVGQVGDITWLWLEKSRIWGFPCTDFGGLAEIVLNQGYEFCQIGEKSHIEQISVFCPWFNKVVDGIEALMCFQEFRAANVVVAAGPGGINGDSLRLSVDFELNSRDAVVSSDGVYFRPNREVDNSIQSVNIVKPRKRANESAFSSDDQPRALPENALLNEGVNGLREYNTKGLGIVGELSDIGGEWEAAPWKIDEHEIGGIGEAVGIGRECHVVVELDWPHAADAVILRWWARAELWATYFATKIRSGKFLRAFWSFCPSTP